MSFSRYAIYHLPDDPALAAFGARWLGWDVATGKTTAQFDIDQIEAATDTPRKYGFHATLKPPFRLAVGHSAEALTAAVETLAQDLAPAVATGLELQQWGRFFVLAPTGDTSDIDTIAAACVSRLDQFRAPPDAAELAKRRQAGLSPLKERMLVEWGYPHVMEAFRCHLTLTGRLPKPTLPEWKDHLMRVLPPLPTPFKLGSIALMGERPHDGRFELIHRFELTSSPA